MLNGIFRSILSFLFRGLLGCLLLWQPAQGQLTGVGAQIPGGYFGTWSLKLKTVPAGSPYPKDTTATLTIAIDGSLCANGLLVKTPTVKPSVSNRIFWTDTKGNLEFSVPTSGFTGIRVTSVSGADYGLFEPESTLDAARTTTDTCDKNETFFDMAQAKYSDLFPGGIFVLTHMTTTEFYRYYSVTDTYLVIRDGVASASGGKFGATPLTLGNVDALVAAKAANLPIPVTAVPSSFDNYYVGTYSLTLQNAPLFSPIPSGTQLTFVITNDKKLCAGETVLSSPLLQTDADTVSWQNLQGGYSYSLKLLPNASRDSAFGQRSLALYSTNGYQLGTFSGNRTALSAECSDAKGTDPDLDTINLMFDLAEQRLPDLFPGGPLTFNQRANGATYRYYEASGITATVKSRQVTVQGGKFGSTAVNAGSLDQVITALQATTMKVQLPTALTGTYALKFASAGNFSPIATGTSVDAAITEEGNLCMDGTIYTNPYVDLNDINLVSWKNTQTGYVVSVNTATSGNTVTLTMKNLKGDVLGALSGGKSLLLAKCAGIVGNNIKIDSANQLFALAEQYYPAQFPPSALTYNQLSSGSLKRYYPSTSTLITVTGDTVQVSGGSYGSTPRTLGSLDGLLAQLQATSSKADLSVTGSMVFQQASLLPITRKIELNETVNMPASTTTADLQNLVQLQLGNELTGTSTYSISVATNTAAKLDFTAIIANSTTVAGTIIKRDYQVRFVYLRK